MTKFLYYQKLFGYKFIDENSLKIPLNSQFLPLKKCDLCLNAKTRKHILTSQNLSAKIMLVFEKPNEIQDRTNEIFVGEYEKLLNFINKYRVYSSFLIKCYCKNPNLDAFKQCIPYIFSEIKTLNPRLIITFGDRATKAILKDENLPSIELIRGSFIKKDGLFVMPTYDLDFVRANPNKKANFLQDLAKIQTFNNSKDN
ncbi:MAG: hypothetical protein MR902_09260 [Campylobacter sp.]|nr:hypothetical protein [Campylobacter sp.]